MRPSSLATTATPQATCAKTSATTKTSWDGSTSPITSGSTEKATFTNYDAGDRRRHSNGLRHNWPFFGPLRRRLRSRTGLGEPTSRHRNRVRVGSPELPRLNQHIGWPSRFCATSCPGANLYAHISSGDLKRRINDLLAAGGVDLQRFCGPDAAAKSRLSRRAINQHFFGAAGNRTRALPGNMPSTCRLLPSRSGSVPLVTCGFVSGLDCVKSPSVLGQPLPITKISLSS